MVSGQSSFLFIIKLFPELPRIFIGLFDLQKYIEVVSFLFKPREKGNILEVFQEGMSYLVLRELSRGKC